MTPLSGLDGAFLHLETPQTPMHVASLHVFDLPDGYRGDFHDDIKRQMRQRVHVAPIFERKLASMPLQFANPVWVHDDAVDLDYHVQRVTLPRPGGQAELEDCAARLHSEPLDRARPLWRLYVIDGLPAGQVGYYIKVHHAVLDGQAGALLAQALFDVTPAPRRVARRGARPAAEHPGLAELAAAALRHDAGQYLKLVRQLPEVIRTLAGLFGEGDGSGVARGMLKRNVVFGPHTPLNVPITGARTYAAQTLPLDALKALAVRHDAKLNDIVLALASGTLRRWLARHGGVPKKPLIAAVPISLRAAGNADFSTQATMSLANLHTHLADPLKRLHAIRDAAGAMKALAAKSRGILPTDFPSIATPWLLHGLASLYGRSGLAGVIPPIANLIVSNVAGPQVPLYAVGARMRSYWPLSVPEHGLALNLTVMSYAGAMGFGFIAARCAVPDAREFSQALTEAYDELSTAAATPRAGRSAPRASGPAPRRRRAVAAATAAARES